MSNLWVTAAAFQVLGEEEREYYHASPNVIPEGTILKPPGRGWTNFDESSGEHTYLTPSLDRAEQYHYMLWEQGHHDSHLYVVKPHGRLEQDPEDHESFRTKDPVEVTQHLCAHDEDD